MFSIGAVGPIDKNLIFRKRKEFDDVKKYTKTVNPDLPGQKIQKGYFKVAIDEWQTAGYSSSDVQAWNLYARTKKVIASGFNRFTGLRINAEKESKTWNKLTNCSIYDVNGEGFKVDIDVASDLSGVLYLGTSKFSMLEEFAGNFLADKYTFVITGLSMQTRYYFYIKNTSANESGRTGIYRQKTTLKAPITIDIGSPAIDRANATPADKTFFDRTNPANGSGKITSVEIWANTEISNLKIATFYGATNIWSTRDFNIIGTVISGSKQIFEVDIDVVIGDVIGYYFTAGGGDIDYTGGLGVLYKNGDHIPCVLASFGNWVGNGLLSLYGEG